MKVLRQPSSEGLQAKSSAGFAARKGRIINDSIIVAPRQRNMYEENVKIKDGEVLEEWDEKLSKQRQKMSMRA